MRAGVERNEDAEFGARVKNLSLFRVLPHCMNKSAVRNSTDNGSPGLSEVSCLENVGFEVVKFMSIYRNKSRVRVVRRRIDKIDSAPLRHFWSHVRPMSAVVSGQLNHAIVGARPQRALLHWRFRQSENRVVIFNRRDVVGERTAARLLFALVVTRKIAADCGPAL